MGWATVASGEESMSFGIGTEARPLYSFVLGTYNIISGSPLVWNSTEPIFIIGNGTSDVARSNAMTVLKNGNVGIGTSTPSAKLHISGGNISLEGGSINDLNGGISVGSAPTGWYSDANNLAARFPGAAGDFYVQSSGGATTYMRVGAGVPGFHQYTGNAIFDNSVAIGTSAPSYKLHVNGSFYATSVQIGNSSGAITPNWWEFGVDNGGGTAIDFHSNSTGTDYSARIYRNPGNNGEFQIVNTGTGNLSFFTQNLSRMTINSTGYTGIGTTAPIYPLHVATAALVNCPGYGYLNSAGGTGTSSGSNYYSIFAENRIRAEEFNADSDIRIKKIIGVSDSEHDLETLNKIKVTDFTYIDTISKGRVVHKKVIAQELKEILPSAVTSTTSFIPSIYARPVSATFDIENHQMVIAMPEEHCLQVGDNVKFIEPVGIWNEKVTMVISPNIFCVNSSKNRDRLFVYGKEVNDFLTVDYEAISMLNVSATQTLVRKMDDQQEEIKSLNDKVARLENAVEEMKLIITGSTGK
jgi:hypothetical protein